MKYSKHTFLIQFTVTKNLTHKSQQTASLPVHFINHIPHHHVYSTRAHLLPRSRSISIMLSQRLYRSLHVDSAESRPRDQHHAARSSRGAIFVINFESPLCRSPYTASKKRRETEGARAIEDSMTMKKKKTKSMTTKRRYTPRDYAIRAVYR